MTALPAGSKERRSSRCRRMNIVVTAGPHTAGASRFVASARWLWAATTLTILVALSLPTMASARMVVASEGDNMYSKYLYFKYSHPDARAVIEVTDDSTGFFQTSTKNRVVKFYSPYCGHCISFRPKYMRVATKAQNIYGVEALEFYAVSCAAWPELCQTYQISVYPTVWAYSAMTEAESTEMHNGQTTTRGNSTHVDVGSMFFSVGKVEKALKLRKENAKSSSSSVSTTSMRQLQQENDNGEGKDEADERHGRGGRGDQMDDDGNQSKRNGRGGGDGDNERGGDEEGENDERNRDGDTATHRHDDEREGDEDEEADQDVLGTEKAAARSHVDLLNEMTSKKVVDDDEASSPDHEFENFKAVSSQFAAQTKLTKRVPGADLALNQPRYMDRFKEGQRAQQIYKQQHAAFQRRRKHGSAITKPTTTTRAVAVPAAVAGATPIMLSNRRDTGEYKARQQQVSEILSHMQKTRRIKRKKRRGSSGGVASWALQQQQQAGQSVAFQKKIARPRLVEAVPVVRRIVRMDQEEELILDASLSFLEGLRVGTYKATGPLGAQQKNALRNWLHLMRVSLPAEWALHDTIDNLIENFDTITQGWKGLEDILNKHSLPRTQWSSSCQRRDGFTCGFWKLLHIMTVGIAEHRGGQDLIESGQFKATLPVFSPKQAADTLREYIKNFFVCTECSRHFIDMYDQCDLHRRCDRLTDDAKTATDADWKELAKWLWEVHNSISVRLVNEKEDVKRKKKQRALILRAAAGPGVASQEAQVQALWPSLEECSHCLREDGTYDENYIFLHLEATYWPGYDLKDTPRRLIWLGDDGEGALGFHFAFLLVVLVILYLLRNKIVGASVAQTMLLRAKASLRARSTGGKLRTI